MRIAYAAAFAVLLAVCLLLSPCSSYAQSIEARKPDQPTGVVTITKPQSGDTLIVDHIAVISFTPQGSIGPNPSLQFTSDSGTSWNVIAALNGGTTYNWVVPNTPSDRALVRVIDSGRVAGVSGRFMILAPGTIDTVIVTGAPDLVEGQNATITWLTSGFVGSSLSIDISYDHEHSWLPIVTNINIGSGKTYPWTAPDTVVVGAVLRLKFSSGSSRYSQPFNIGKLGVDEASLKSEIYVVPNPSSHSVRLHFSTPEAVQAEILITDIAGRTELESEPGILGSGEHDLMLDISTLAPGLHRVTLLSGKNMYQSEIMVVR